MTLAIILSFSKIVAIELKAHPVRKQTVINTAYKIFFAFIVCLHLIMSVTKIIIKHVTFFEIGFTQKLFLENLWKIEFVIY